MCAIPESRCGQTVGKCEEFGAGVGWEGKVETGAGLGGVGKPAGLRRHCHRTQQGT